MADGTFVDAKASAARNGVNLDASQRPLVEAGEPYTVTLDITPDLSGFTDILERYAKRRD